MRLWTLQPVEVYETLKRDKVFRADPKKSLEEDEDLFAEPYKWMIEQMENRIGPRPKGVELPVWAWYRWSNTSFRPNITTYAADTLNTVEVVRMDLEVESPVLLSDFDNWHFVLNYWYLAANEWDEENYQARREAEGFDLSCRHLNKKDVSIGHEEIKKSWENIFNIGFGNGYVTDGNSIQATFWELKLDWVKNVKQFRGTRKA